MLYIYLIILSLYSSALMELVLSVTGGINGSPFVINPARASPKAVKPHKYPNSNNPVVSFRTANGQYQRGILWSVGLILSCNVHTATPFGGKTTTSSKQVILSPLRGEHERTISFLAEVLGSVCLAVPTFNVKLSGSTERIHGVSIRTFPLSVATESDNPNGASCHCDSTT